MMGVKKTIESNNLNETFISACNIMRFLCNGVGSCHAYSTWGLETKNDEINNMFKSVKQTYDETFWRKVFTLSEYEKRILGFRKWEENDPKMCIPIWIWECLPDDMIIAEGKNKTELDNDTRFGCVWWRV